MLAVGLPTCIFGAVLILGVARPRLGPAGVLCFSQLLMVLAAALLCALPWGEGPVLVLYIMAAVLATLPTPSFLSMLAHRYPLHEQALHAHRARTAHAPRRTRTACRRACTHASTRAGHDATTC